MSDSQTLPRWTVKFLRITAAYYLLLGISSFVWPTSWFWASGIRPTDLEQSTLLLQIAGTPLYALAFGALLASFSARHFWAVLSILFIHNLIDVFVNVHSIQMGRIATISGVLFMGSGFFFSAGLGFLLWRIYRLHVSSLGSTKPIELAEALELKPEGSAKSIGELSDEGLLLLVMIRHTGCTFCREALDRLSKELKEHKGPIPKIVVVGLSAPGSIREIVNRYELKDVEVLSDPEQKVYRALEIPRGSLWQLFGPKEIFHAFIRGGIFKYGLGGLEGDPFQLPGSALLRNRKIVRLVRPKSAADYCEFSRVISEPDAVSD